MSIYKMSSSYSLSDVMSVNRVRLDGWGDTCAECAEITFITYRLWRSRSLQHRCVSER